MKIFYRVILILLPIISAFGQEGYPKPGVTISGVFKNSFCFPVVVSANKKTWSIDSSKSQDIQDSKWGEWNWLPGKVSQVSEKTVLHPLKNKPPLNFGPGQNSAHQGRNKYGYDFPADEGTPVHAIESGIVSKVVQNYTKAHDDPKKDLSNKVEVVHEDGTVSSYVHLKPNSAKVGPCEKVKEGQILAESGNTGYSSGPHLHIDVYRPIDGLNYTTIPLKFK
ncbi:M23 family metallopeptidase [Peredibacter starrii]|uniref:M23 family metallopeptidase n=1 Tax=Peredibacter starrii TaxID=28202 RepID=A0AAX4HMC7_9BACT|nr:M23 family metallopeptidase [Peredibacter starrii]WPU64278.1 M23 family metallopeptidase [Peredibacter starrii]